MSLSIISADQRQREQSGVKALVLGPYGVGKTSLLRTLDWPSTLFVDGEAGDLAVQDVPVDTIRPLTWPECRHLACYIGGPDPNRPDHLPYSQAHFDAACEIFSGADLTRYETVFLDSVTKFSRLCLQWALTQPEAFNQQGKPDTRGAYGLLAREILAWVQHLQHTRRLNVVLTCAMEQAKNDFGQMVWEAHIEGSKAGRELPGIVDMVISMTTFADAEGGSYRAFVCQKDNPYGLPAKDRSGRLDLMEEPHLGKLIAKASDQQRKRAELRTSIAHPAQQAS